MGNLGHAHVHSVWAYQGSKPFASRGRLYAAHGETVSSADPRSDRVFWKKAVGPAPEAGQELQLEVAVGVDLGTGGPVLELAAAAGVRAEHR